MPRKYDMVTRELAEKLYQGEAVMMMNSGGLPQAPAAAPPQASLPGVTWGLGTRITPLSILRGLQGSFEAHLGRESREIRGCCSIKESGNTAESW